MTIALRLQTALVLLSALIVTSCGSSSDQPLAPAPATTTTPATAKSPIPGYEVVQVANGGSISGMISLSAPTPKLPARAIKKDPNVCGTEPRASEQLFVSPSGGVKNVVVIVEGVKRGKAVPDALVNAQIDQKNCDYSPHVTAIPVGTGIAIKNSDPMLHNIHFYQNDESLFNIAQPVQGQVDKRNLDRTGMVFAECDVHGWMQGHIAVVDSPYLAITDENGKFTISEVPPGTYKVRLWQEYLGEKTLDVAVNAGSDSALNNDLRDLLMAKTPAAAPVTATPAAAPASADKAAAKTADKKSSSGAQVVVHMTSDGNNFKFEPAEITVKVGTTVKWINDSENRHTSTDDPQFEKTTGEAKLPAGAEAWSSPFLVNGESYMRTFTVPGTYRYFCRNHGQFGMEGTVIVVP